MNKRKKTLTILQSSREQIYDSTLRDCSTCETKRQSPPLGRRPISQSNRPNRDVCKRNVVPCPISLFLVSRRRE